MSLLQPSPSQIVEFPPDEPPRLLASIDAEEEFDWGKVATRESHSISSIRFRWRSQEIFERYGICPTYMVDHPIANDERTAEELGDLAARGRCCIGSHLHPWTNPPHEEEISTRTSFPGNLPPDLERRKLLALTDLIEDRFGQRPVVYRAGRYGIGPHTEAILEALGYQVDMSVNPLRDYSDLGGPDFTRAPTRPYWFGSDRQMLEIPLTAGYTGALRSFGRIVAAPLNSRLAAQTHFPGALARSGLLTRVYITPEGMPIEHAKQLTRDLFREGHRIFTVHFHSPSLQPGNTPYVATNFDLERFLAWLEIYFDFFIIELGGVPTTPSLIYEYAKSLAGAPATISAKASARVVPRPAELGRGIANRKLRAASEQKWLMIATNFAPVHGGSAVVYENLCRFSPESCVVLTAWRSYSSDDEIVGWRHHDRDAQYPIHRVELLRPRVATAKRGFLRNAISFMLEDAPLMLGVFAKTKAIVREYKIGVICVGELVYGGWLSLACRYLLGCKTILYIHGEEITITGTSRSERLKRTYLQFCDRVVGVSRFTRDALVRHLRVDLAKISLIENGVDLNRFYEQPKSTALLDRHGLHEKTILLSVGRVVARKGFDTVLTAMPQILIDHPDVHYLIVGEGPYRADLEALVERYQLSEHVTFAGRVSDQELGDYYSLAQIFLLPNREMPDGDTEGFGLVYLEANACGKPVISGRAGGVLDAVHEGVNGLTVDGSDPSSVVAAVNRLLADPELYARLRAGALTTAKESSWAKRAEQFNSLCRELVEPTQ